MTLVTNNLPIKNVSEESAQEKSAQDKRTKRENHSEGTVFLVF